MVAVDLKARCTTADRVRTRLLEFCEREGVDYVKALFRRMLEVAEQGARARIRTWADGVYRSVHFANAVGLKQGLVRSCYMTVTKDGDHLLVDFTGTGRDPSSYNAHPQAAIGHFANYVYEYLFHDLPISNATFAPIDFKFEPGSCLYPDVRAATSNSVMIATGVMSAVHNTFAKAVFSTEHWRQAGASQGNGGNAVVLAGMSQWSSPFADMLAYSINTEGQGALPEMDGMNAFGFPWCPAGRAPDVELVENEFPLFIPISSHWKDSAGHGKYRGGVGTAQLWVAHHVPMVFMMAIADNSKIQTPQGLFGGYAPCTIPGVSVASADLMQRLEAGDAIDLDITEVLRSHSIGGQWGNEFQGRAPRPYMENDVITVAFATGGAGYGDPLERDPEAVGDDIDKGLVSEWAAEHVYQVVWDPQRRRVDAAATERRRAAERRARIARGRPYEEFEAEWLQRKPPEEILTWYGSWPDAKPLAAADASLTRPGMPVPALAARSRARLLARHGRASPALVCPLVLAQAAEIEALPVPRFLTDATKLANGLRALHTAFGNDVIVTAAADDLAAAAAGAGAAAAGAGHPPRTRGWRRRSRPPGGSRSPPTTRRWPSRCAAPRGWRRSSGSRLPTTPRWRPAAPCCWRWPRPSWRPGRTCCCWWRPSRCRRRRPTAGARRSPRWSTSPASIRPRRRSCWPTPRARRSRRAGRWCACRRRRPAQARGSR